MSALLQRILLSTKQLSDGNAWFSHGRMRALQTELLLLCSAAKNKCTHLGLGHWVRGNGDRDRQRSGGRHWMRGSRVAYKGTGRGVPERNKARPARNRGAKVGAGAGAKRRGPRLALAGVDIGGEGGHTADRFHRGGGRLDR